jgi:ferredoxin
MVVRGRQRAVSTGARHKNSANGQSATRCGNAFNYERRIYTGDHRAAKPQPIATRYRRVGVWACRRDCRGNALTVTSSEYPNRNLARLRPTASLPRNPNLCDLCGLLCKILIRSQLQPGVTTQRVVRLCTAAQRAEESLPHYWPPVTLTSNNLQ